LHRHILLNLLSNARKYSADDAQVDFSATRELEDAIFVVRDYGIGIPENDLPHIFEAFTRASNVADAPGTGLGLAIVQRCVAMHGGTIKLDSIAGTGTTVRVRLPLFTHTPS
jgi:signal transduction histidine kinase